MCESVFHVPLKESKAKQTPNHPWEKIIKDSNFNKIKYAHNSIKNPTYPKEKEKKIGNIKFTVIGNRMTKEFIYCAKLVKGMHRYRKRLFCAPVIRGVSELDWPLECSKLRTKYSDKPFCIFSQVAVLCNNDFIGGEQELKNFIESQYIYHLCIDYHVEAIENFISFVNNSKRPFVYLHITIDEKDVGTMIFMLYSDIVPNTCRNFLRLAKTNKGGYSGSPVHRIVRDGWIQCGGFNLKSTDFYCENFIIPHDRRGVLCMCNDGRDIDCSTQFFVLLQPAPWMAYKYVAFGQLIDGDKVLKKIEEVPDFYESPTVPIIIAKSGILNLDCRNIVINKGAKGFLNKHIDDLVTAGEMFIEMILQRVWAVLAAKRKAKKEKKQEQDDDLSPKVTEEESDVHLKKEIVIATTLQKKEVVLEEQGYSSSSTSVDITVGPQKTGKSRMDVGQVDAKVPVKHKDIDDAKVDDLTPLKELKSRNVFETRQLIEVPINYDEKERKESYHYCTPDSQFFDPALYHYEESSYDQGNLGPREEKKASPEKPFYLPLTDVPYPGEKDSTYDLKCFLKGDYCLFDDLAVNLPKDEKQKSKIVIRYSSIPSDMALLGSSKQDYNQSMLEDLSSEEELELMSFIKSNVDRVSFAGGIIRNIGKGNAMFNLFDDKTKADVVSINDDEFKKVRPGEAITFNDEAIRKFKSKVPASVSEDHVQFGKDAPPREHSRIMRRPTGFIRPQDLAKICAQKAEESSDEDNDNDVVPDFREPSIDDSSDHSESSSYGQEEKKSRQQQQHFAEDIARIKSYQKDIPSTDEDTDSDGKLKETPSQIKRRPTGFVKPGDFAKLNINLDDSDEEDLEEPPIEMDKSTKMKRRQTGYLKKKDLQDLNLYDDDSSDSVNDEQRDYDTGRTDRKRMEFVEDSQLKKVKRFQRDEPSSTADDKKAFVESASQQTPTKPGQRPTSIDVNENETGRFRSSVLTRLFEEANIAADATEPPTLKNYVPLTDRIPRNMMLTFGKNIKPDSEKRSEHEQARLSISIKENEDFNNIVRVQYGKRESKISNDYVQRLFQMEILKEDATLSSVAFSKVRPFITVQEYQQQNRDRLTALKLKKKD